MLNPMLIYISSKTIIHYQIIMIVSHNLHSVDDACLFNSHWSSIFLLKWSLL